MSQGVSVQGISAQGVSDQGVCVLGVSVRGGVHVRGGGGGSVLSPSGSSTELLSHMLDCERQYYCDNNL